MPYNTIVRFLICSAKFRLFVGVVCAILLHQEIGAQSHAATVDKEIAASGIPANFSSDFHLMAISPLMQQQIGSKNGASELAGTMNEKDIKGVYESAIVNAFATKDVGSAFYFMESYRVQKLKQYWPAAAHYPAVELKHFQGRLKDGVRYFSVFDREQELYIMLVSSTSVKYQSVRFPGFKDSVKALQRICSNQLVLNTQYNSYARLAYLLYEKLLLRCRWSPVNYWWVLVIVFSLTRHFAWIGKGQNFLLCNYEISYTYAASWYLNSKSRSRAVNIKLAGLAPERCMSDGSLTQEVVNNNAVPQPQRRRSFLTD